MFKFIFDPETLSPILEKNDNISSDKQIKNRLVFDKSLKGYKIDLPGEIFNSEQILDAIHVINYIKRNKYRNIGVLFNFLCSSIADKLVYVIFEDLCYYFINKIKCRLYVLFPKLKSTILTDGIRFSAICQLPDKQNFNKTYMKHIYMRHYRDVISITSITNTELSILNQNIRYFLNN